MTEKRVVAVTGASSGIGLATARLFHQRGCVVYGLSRTPPIGEAFAHIPCDVADAPQVEAAFQAIAAKEGRLDVLVACAGYGISGPVEHTPAADAAKLFDVNFFGLLRCDQAALPYLRQSKGVVIHISSVAARCAIPFQAFYSACKAAVNALTLAMANELKPLGMRVCAVMPGDIRTGFTDRRVKLAPNDAVYGEAAERAVAAMERDERGGMPPEAVAETVFRVAGKKRPKPLVTVGLRYKAVVFLEKALPARVVNAIVGRMYR